MYSSLPVRRHVATFRASLTVKRYVLSPITIVLLALVCVTCATATTRALRFVSAFASQAMLGRGAATRIVARHPCGVEVEFDPRWNSFRFAGGRRLTPVSRIAAALFPFDANAVAARLSVERNCSPADVKAEWSRSIVLGRNVAARLRATLLREPQPAFEEAHGEEDAFFAAAARAALLLQRRYERVVATDAIVCSPSWGVAGRIDYLFERRVNDAASAAPAAAGSAAAPTLAIVSVATTTSALSAFRFSTWDAPCAAPVSHVVNAREKRAAIEAAMLGALLRREGYAKTFGPAVNSPSIECVTVLIGRESSGSSAAVAHVSVHAPWAANASTGASVHGKCALSLDLASPLVAPDSIAEESLDLTLERLLRASPP
jgi:hypothetical protein